MDFADVNSQVGGSVDEEPKELLGPHDELDYPALLNRILPEDIKVLGWADMSKAENFSARFSCQSRTYRYLFVRRTLDVEKMRVRVCVCGCGLCLCVPVSVSVCVSMFVFDIELIFLFSAVLRECL
jgi:tRNA U38,U39,U40 pseudouridine synthase TruA